jgi:hypothetical protein
MFPPVRVALDVQPPEIKLMAFVEPVTAEFEKVAMNM